MAIEITAFVCLAVMLNSVFMILLEQDWAYITLLISSMVLFNMFLYAIARAIITQI